MQILANTHARQWTGVAAVPNQERPSKPEWRGARAPTPGSLKEEVLDVQTQGNRGAWGPDSGTLRRREPRFWDPWKVEHRAKFKFPGRVGFLVERKRAPVQRPDMALC